MIFYMIKTKKNDESLALKIGNSFKPFLLI